jgi:hypothetical protein
MPQQGQMGEVIGKNPEEHVAHIKGAMSLLNT